MASAPGSKTGRSGKGGPSHNEGDWICSDKNCANINFSWRANCNKCGKEKGKVDVIKKTGAEIGKQAAARSGGLFSAEDWQCSVCANVNWARRSECNLCHTPKFNISEARTGAGGGYNERENVEYKERDESDDEYDEFGRKKKKFRQKSNGSRQSTTITYELEKGKAEILDLSRVPLATSIATTAAAEEEEDEEDDDEDVSKYDLMAGSDDETPPTSGTKGTGPQSRNSHSRSPKHRRVSSRSQSSRSRSRSPGGGSRARRRGGARSRSPSPRQHRRSRSSSRSRNRRRTSSRSRSRSPHRRRSGGSKDRGRRQSRSRSRSRDRRRRSHSRSRSRSRSRDRRRSYRSRSRSRDRDSYR